MLMQNRVLTHTFALIVFLLLGFHAQLFAKQEEDFFKMSLEELMEVDVFVSTSRQAQRFGEPSGPISIITADDIHYSGLTSIPEILQFAPGVDVLKIIRHRYAIGIRGLHETISDRTMLLVNGRPADNTAYGGPDFTGLPVPIEDIDRIEIVRSPGSASWGANSLTGVINIITKKPKDILGVMGQTTISEFGDSYTHLRWAAKEDKWSWRASTAYQEVEDSGNAIDGPASFKSFQPALNAMIGFNNFVARDFCRNQRFDTEIYYDASEATQASFGLGQTHVESGDFEYGGYYPMKNMREEHVRSFARVDHKFDDGSSGFLQLFSKYWNANWPQASLLSTMQNEIEGQLDYAPSEIHQRSIGASFRWDHINTGRETPQQIRLSGEPLDEYNAGLFLIDRWFATRRLIIEDQIRGDWYSGTQTDFSGRLSALYGIDDKRNHVVRLSAAKAYRTPLSIIRKSNLTTIPMGSGMYAINVTAPSDLDNEETYALEAGYTGRLTEKLTLRIDSYYQRFKKMIGYQQTTNLLGQTFAVADNIDGADAWGVETELVMQNKAGKLSAWYAFNDFQPDQGDQDLRSFLPAKHKAGMTGRVFLPDGWAINANYIFTNTTPGNPATRNNVSSSNRLDLAISKDLAKGKGQILIGASDLLTKTHDPIRESVQYTGHKVPGRTFFIRLQLKF